MAALKQIFIDGVNTIFDVFEEAVKTGTYNLTDDKGWGSSTPSSCPIRCIFDEFTQKDVNTLSFSELIQPTDVKGLVPGEDVTIEMSTQGYCILNGIRYSVEGHDIDPMSVVYTLLLRKN